MAGAKNHKHMHFPTSFLNEQIWTQWQQYKLQIERNSMVPISLNKFKAFVRNWIGETSFFVDGIWSKTKKNSQFQVEEIQDRIAYLKYLQSILMEFDSVYTPTEDYLGQYCYEGLKPLIKVWLNEKRREKLAQDELIRKTIRAKSTTKIQKDWDLDQ